MMIHNIYSFLSKYHVIVGFILLIQLFFSIWIILSYRLKTKLLAIIKKPLKDSVLRDQICLLISIILINAFTCLTLNDYWKFTKQLPMVISIVQVVGILLLFVRNKDTESIRKTVILGFVCLILEFTHIYYYLALQIPSGFSGTRGITDDLSIILKWSDYLFYSISLILPYPLTELQPKTVLFKTLSLLQIGIFYLFIFNKISDAFSQKQKNIQKNIK